MGSSVVSMLERLGEHSRRFHSGWGIREGEEPLGRVKVQALKMELAVMKFLELV